jgi:hypothetical protein
MKKKGYDICKNTENKREETEKKETKKREE